MNDKSGSGTRLEGRQEVRKDTKNPIESRFYESLASIHKDRIFADGEKVFIGTGYAEYTYRRTSKIDALGGEWIPTGAMSDISGTYAVYNEGGAGDVSQLVIVNGIITGITTV